MNLRTKSILAAAAIGLGFAATPASAQVGGYNRGLGYTERAPGYDRDGSLNVWGARLDPRVASGGGFGGPVGGVLGGVGNVVGGVTSGVGTAVGGTVGAADDIATGSLGGRRTDYSARGGNAEQLDRPVPQYGRESGGPRYGY